MHDKIELEGDFIKLDQLLKFSGIASTGGQAKIIITNGGVKVNDEIVVQRGKKIRPGDVIEVEGVKIEVG